MLDFGIYANEIQPMPDARQRRMSATRTYQVTDTSIDRVAMGRLAKALVFICGATHPTTVALKTASDTGTERDIKHARMLFLKLKPGDRKAAMAMIED